MPKPTEQEKALSWLEPLNRVDNEAPNTDTLAKKHFQLFFGIWGCSLLPHKAEVIAQCSPGRLLGITVSETLSTARIDSSANRRYAPRQGEVGLRW